MKIIIKSAYHNHGDKYWFAENETGKLFGSISQKYGFYENGFFFLKYQFESLVSLKECLNNYKKSLEKPKTEGILVL
jgi:hypothetical protein